MTSFSGYIVAGLEPREITVAELEMSEPETPHGPTLQHAGDRFGIKGWEEFVLHSPTALNDEIEKPSGGFSYPVLVVRGFGKMIILAWSKKIVEYTLARILDRRIYPNLRKVNVFIDRLIGVCDQPTNEFLVTSVHGKFAGPATQLRSISLYGDDVTKSSLYGDYHDAFNFSSCGLGRRLHEGLPRLAVKGNKEPEIVRIANDGFLFLNLTTRKRAQELNRVVDFVVGNRLVEDWVPIRGAH
ncbi:hypothetical protein BH10PLA2_BH10PLA2_38100 [soil metagenome]